MEAIQIVTYACAALFVGFVVARVVKYMKTPIHLRWELYPVAHEKGRADYGGSIFEELDWWKKPREVDRINELKEMFAEIVFLKGVYHNNKKLWWVSFPFHFGLYLLIGWMALLLLVGILAAAGASLAGGFGRFLQIVVALLGYGGLGLTLLGGLGLFFRRLGDPGIRRYSAPIEYINLLLILAPVGLALVYHAAQDPWFGLLGGYVASLVSFSGLPLDLPAAVQVEIVLGSLLLAYMPLSRMGHFIAKYFLYHDVRWADEPNPRGGKIEGRLKQAFGYQMKWQAPHIQSGKSWVEVGSQLEGLGEEKEEKK